MTLPKHTQTATERLNEFVKLGKEIEARFAKVKVEAFPDDYQPHGWDIGPEPYPFWKE